MSVQRLLAALLAAVWLCGAALAEPSALVLSDERLCGTVASDADEARASCVLRYEYPQFVAQTDADRAINDCYQAMARDMARVAEEQARACANAVDERHVTEITFSVTHSGASYVSVLQTALEWSGSATAESVSADTFARDGVYAGQRVTLTQVLGLEQEGGELSDGESVAERLAYHLVWQLIEHDRQSADSDYLDGVTPDSLRGAFSPETDFYLDADGNVVFFIQAGLIAGEIAGTLQFTFAPAELLSAARES